MGGGGGGSTTTVQKADPWAGIQPALLQLYQGALDQYKTGGAQYYPGSTLAGTNDTIQQALQMGKTAATGNNPAMQGLNDTASGYNLYSNPAFGSLQKFGNGQYVGEQSPNAGAVLNTANGGYLDSNPANATYSKFASGNFNNYLTDAQNGKYLDQQNPYLSQLYTSATNQMVDQFQKAVAPGIASQFSLAGRMGSGSHAAALEGAQTSLGKGLADASSSIYGNAYENERQRQQAAANSISGFQMQGAGGLSSNFNFERQLQQQAALAQQQQMMQQRAMQLQGANDLSNTFNQGQNRQQQAQLALPGLKYNDIEKLMGIGQYEQSQSQAQIDADKARFDFGQNAPAYNLQQLSSLLQGGSAYRGNTSTSNTQTNSNPFSTGLGALMVGNGLYGTGALGNLTQGSGLLGGMSDLFSQGGLFGGIGDALMSMLPFTL